MQRYHLVATDGLTKATIVPDRGGFVSSLILPFQSGPRETLFLHDYAWNTEINDLPGGIPFLFPVCARIARNNQVGVYLFEGKQYQLKIHGFSWFEKWSVQQAQSDAIELILKDNENTLACYPFRFEIKLKYIISNGKLTCHQTYRNCEENKSMPYYAGFHPYFLTPQKEKVILDFHAICRLKYNENLTDIVGEQSLFKTPVNITDPEINEQLCVLGENKLATLTFANGEILKTTVFGAPDIFSYLQLYTIPDKPFFCVERWMSFPNALNTVSGVRWLKAGKSEEAVFEVFIL